MIDRDHAVSITQLPNDVSPGERPCRISVNAKNGFAASFVDVMNLLTIHFNEMRLERILILEAMFSSKPINSSHVPLSKVQSMPHSDSAGRNFRNLIELRTPIS
jgi:hypothetical protein